MKSYELRCRYCSYPATGALDLIKHFWEEHNGLLGDTEEEKETEEEEVQLDFWSLTDN